jgi:ribonucleotide reductase beta subunit family protein with ferritin-like domain
MKLSLYEQETIILYNQAEATAEVYSHDPRLLEKLRRLAEKYPDQIVKKDRQTFTASQWGAAVWPAAPSTMTATPA